jgi:chemotaxis protein CheD
MSNLILGIGDFGVSKDPSTAIKTYALGSCVAVILYCPTLPAAAMIHVALPEAKVNPARAKEKPGFFADSGLPQVIRALSRIGAPTKGRGVRVKLVGGASIMDKNEIFNIGKRNLLAVKKILWAHGLGAVAEDVGGNLSRTVSINVADGEVKIVSAGRGSWTL